MSGSTSPLLQVGQVAGLATASGASGMVLAATGSSIFQYLFVGFGLVFALVLITRTIKTISTDIENHN
ncbi:MAG TPA: hypothetical protein PKU78_00695 [Candidatus Dojkabacteria bacterium]|nr:hypothetical protein [Candidatus Dojkabacteria bacterium]HRO64718.1 hypothetical protein [Candidatus Dojkabacteria bacterium]HRP37360.1 hypothetical protein [Candidatus Dojkabacteria bacterium]HRP51553.1 hypothetical protein [Candidatus Dojkabacteria bacterium]